MRHTNLIFPWLRCFAAFLLIALSGYAQNNTLQTGGENTTIIDASQFKHLQNAIDALPPGGGVIELPPGRFELEKPLVLNTDFVTIRGAGSSTHLVNVNKNGQPALHIEPPAEQGKLNWIQITDLRISGNPQSGNGLEAVDIEWLLLSRLSVDHNGGDGILMDHCNEDPRVADCLITYNGGAGINLLACHDMVVSANQIEDNQDGVRCIGGFNLTMTGNNFDDQKGHGLVIEDTYGSVVSGNMIEESIGHAVVLSGACYGISLSANTFTHCQGEGVRLEGVKDITLSANGFVLMRQYALHALDGASQLTITGNTFSRFPYDPSKPLNVAKAHKTEPGQGILLENVHDITLNGNTFSEPSGEAILITGQKNQRINITGNTIVNPSHDHPGEKAAVDIANLTGSIITNNTLTDNQEQRTMKQAFLFRGECDFNIVSNNLIFGDKSELSIPGKQNRIRDNMSF